MRCHAVKMCTLFTKLPTSYVDLCYCYWQSITQQHIQNVTPYDIKLVFVQKITFILRKINKNCCHQSCSFWLQLCTKSFVGCRDPSGGADSASPDPLAVYRGPTFKGRGGEGTSVEGKVGSSYFARGRERKSRRLWMRVCDARHT